MKRSRLNQISFSALLAFFISVAAYQPLASAAALDLSEFPLAVGGAHANILLTYDSSGSMTSGYMPDGLDAINNTKRYCSSKKNQIYYNPTTRYRIPVDGSGSALYGSISLNAALNCNTNPFETSCTTTINLSTSYKPIGDEWTGSGSYAQCGQGSSGQAAFYFKFNTSLAGCDGTVDDEDCYQKVTVSSTSGPGTTDINGDGLVDASDKDERQNFAIWYSFYRTRDLAAKSAIGLAFANFPTNLRVSGQTLTDPGEATALNNSPSLMTRFVGASRTTFLNRLYRVPSSGGTPLRQTTDRAGRYFQVDSTVVSSADSPYRKVPGDASSEELSCRQNFHILTTDGYWNNSGASAWTAPGDYDGSSQTVPGTTSGATYSYDGRAPYGGDSASDTLADVAFKYWVTDLRPTLDNNVPPYLPYKTASDTTNFYDPRHDPAEWQHMVTYTIGMGTGGSLNPADYDAEIKKKAAPSAGTYPTWNDGTVDSNAEKNNDLWHAAVNSRGKFFTANNPDQFSDALDKVIGNIASRLGSGSALAANSGNISTSARVFQAQYDAGWVGHLRAYKQSYNSTTKKYDVTEDWNSSETAHYVVDPNNRVVITNTTPTGPTSPTFGAGVAFRWATGIDAAQQAKLNDNPDTRLVDNDGLGSARLTYLRDVRSTDTKFRSRNASYKLGDIVNSSPVYVGNKGFGYTDAGYAAFVSGTVATRKPMVYVGANDGMLHGFDASLDASGDKTATSGDELLAYIPNKVFKNLSGLTSIDFAHKFFVNGPITVRDVYGDFGATRCGGSSPCWRTVLVGALGKGGQGVFALDVTNPANFSEANAGNTFLWEYTDVHDADMGYTFGTPAVVKLRNGSWATIVSNGYNNTEADGNASTTGRAALFVIDIVTGARIAKVPVTGGSTTTPNGLATPAPVDTDGDGTVDYAYAGDLLGKMWKFDLTDSSATPSFSSSELFDAGQPITARPEVGVHPSSATGYMVYFGTGKYLERKDNETTGAPTKYFYGIWDKGATVSNNSTDILAQTVLQEATGVNGNRYRIISDNTMTWRTGGSGYLGWSLELPTLGEMQVTTPLLRGTRIIFNTLIPRGANDSCSGGNSGWLMILDINNGGRTDFSVFDTDGDGDFDQNDRLTDSFGNPIVGNGTFMESGAGGDLLVQNDPGRGVELIGWSGSDGSVGGVPTNPGGRKGRQSWRQLK